MTYDPLPTIEVSMGAALRLRHVAGSPAYKAARAAIGVLLGWDETGTALRVRRAGELTVERWDALTGALLGAVEEPSDNKPGMVQGRAVIATSATMSLTRRRKKNQLEVWRAGRPVLAKLTPPDGTLVAHAVFADDERAVVAALDDGSLACWDIATAALRWRAPAYPGDVVTLAASPDGATIYSLGQDDRLCATAHDGAPRWSVFLGRAVIRGNGEANRIAPSPDGARVAVGRPALALRVFDAESGAERSVVDGHDGMVTCVAASADGGLIASGGWDQDVRIVDVAAGAPVWTLETADDDLRSVAFLLDRPAVRTVDGYGSIQRWSLATGLQDERVTLGDRRSVRAHGALDGSRLLVEHLQGIEVWSDRSAERVVWSLDLTTNRPHAAGFDDRGGRVIACRNDGNWLDLRFQLEAWEAASGRELGVVRRLDGRCLALAETYDGLLSVVAAADALVVTEEWGEQRERRVGGPPGDINRVQVSTDGRRMVGSDARRVVVWQLAPAPSLLGSIDVGAAGDRVTALAISADGSTLAIGTARGCVLTYAIGSKG